MRIAVTSDGADGGTLAPIGADGTVGPREPVGDLASAVGAIEAAPGPPPRWVWADTATVYTRLLDHGVRVARCHDVELVESLLLAHAGRFGEARSVGAAWARLHGRTVPDDPTRRAGEGAAPAPALFEPDLSTVPAGVDRAAALAEVHTDQLRRIAALPEPGRFSLLAAVESAGALSAAEMRLGGIPWRADVHDSVLAEHLGPRPPAGARPPVLADLAARIAAEFGAPVNPDSPRQLLRAFTSAGHPVESTRSWVLERVDHPAVPLLLRYKELARLHSAHGWAWLDSWVRHGRFRPDYVVGGVVSGRWATRGGGALQIPKVLRRAVLADPGWVLVAADAGQLEPRVLAAVSGDAALADAAGADDLYARLAGVFGGDRQRAKIGVLAALYGQTGGDAAPLLHTLRGTFPVAMAFVDAAARAGEEGRLVRSLLGRTCPPPSEGWERGVADGAGREDTTRAARGRFTRNFVVQATAAEWALVFMAAVRSRLAAAPAVDGEPRLVFFQHDEVVLHVPRSFAPAAVGLLHEAEAETRALLFGATPVRFPLDIAVVDSYSDA